MQSIDLGYAATLEPRLAVDYFRSKGFAITHDWQQASQQLHAQAFTVAKAVRMDVLEDIFAEVDNATANGITNSQFIKNLTPTLQAKGWWGKQIHVDSQGHAKSVQLGSPHRLNTILRTNLAVNYQAARYQQQLASTDTHPYWQYLCVIDKNTRPEHKALHGRVFRWDDPMWQTLYPPNGWGCRCRVRVLTASQVKSMGLKIESSVGRITTESVETGVDIETGEVYQSDVSTYQNGAQRMKTDAGWSGNVGRAAMGSDVNIARKLVTMQNRALRKQVIQSLNNANARQNAFNNWIGNILTVRRPSNAVQPLGFMSDDVAEAVKSRTGAEPARLLAVSEKNVIHADSVKHQQKGVALTLVEYQQLPKAVTSPRAVLWDRQNRNLLYITDSGSETIKTVVNAPHRVRHQADRLDVVINTYKVPLSELKKGIAGGNYELLQGGL